MCRGEVINYDKGNKKCISTPHAFFESSHTGSFDMALTGAWNTFENNDGNEL